MPHAAIQPFVFVKAFPRVLGANGVFGTQTTVTPGFEAAGNIPGGFNFDALWAIQRGSYSNESIEASAGYIKAGYRAANCCVATAAAGRVRLCVGQSADRTRYEIETFDQQYPSNHNAFGLTDLFGFQNIKEERINLDLTPTKHLALLIQQEWLQVASRQDNVYNGSAAVVVKAPDGGIPERRHWPGVRRVGKVGHLRDYMVMNVGVGHFSPGTLMRENAHGAPLTLAYMGLTYRFKLNHEGLRLLCASKRDARSGSIESLLAM